MAEYKYRYVEYPYLSKTAIKEYMTCKYRFRLRYIDGIETENTVAMSRGTYLHDIYDRFFDAVDTKVLWELQDEPFNLKSLRSTALYEYIESTVLSLADPELYGDTWFVNPVTGFITFETLHAANLMRDLSTKDDFDKYFLPKHREIFLKEDKLQIYGTIDRVSLDYDPDRTIIMDYKNVHAIPKPLKSDVVSNGYSTKLPPRYIKEGNFYVLLYVLTQEGYSLDLSLPRTVKFLKSGKVERIAHNYDYAFLFLPFSHDKTDKFYYARKRASNLSIKSLINLMIKIRNENIYERLDNVMVCRRCPYYESQCRGKLPQSDPLLDFDI